LPHADQGSQPAAAQTYPGVADTPGVLRDRPVWLRYVAALALTALAILLRRWLDTLGDGVVAFTLFYLVVLGCTFFGGVGPGLLSLSVSAVAVTFFWLAPIGAFALTGTAPVNLALFVVTSGIIILVAHLLRTAHFRLRQSEARLSLSQDVGRIGVWELDLKSGDIWWSPMLYKVTGISSEKAPGIDAFIGRIDPVDRDRVSEAFAAAREGRDRLDLQFRFNRDDGETLWLTARAELFRDAEGNPSRLLGSNIDITSVRTIESERNRANTLLRTLFDSFPGAAYVKDAEGRILLGNPGFDAVVGLPPEDYLGRTDLDFVSDPDHARAIMEHDRMLLCEGVSRQFEEELILPDGQLAQMLSIKSPFTDAEGRIAGLVGISLDMTERRTAERRLRFLANEVDHRAKNLMGVVQSIVRLTRAEDIAAFKEALTGRIQALARAHNLLAASRWEGVALATLVNKELAPFVRTRGERIRISGPPVQLEPGASQAVTMALHELAINAARYGALSVETGELTVIWRLDRDAAGPDRLELVWSEACGPPVTAQVEPGFGATAIRGAIEHQLAGEIAFDWAPTGLVCRIAFPVMQAKAPDRPRSAPPPRPPSGSTPRDSGTALAGRRILILDDEALLAVTLKEAVEERGAEVVGPANHAQAALALIRERAPDLAILDVNLGGTSSAPVATALKALGIPFVYCTGYAEPAEQIDLELQAEMLTKPVDPSRLAEALERALGTAPSR
jgi:PAS domain S-box-containing protein